MEIANFISIKRNRLMVARLSSFFFFSVLFVRNHCEDKKVMSVWACFVHQRAIMILRHNLPKVLTPLMIYDSRAVLRKLA